MSDVGPTGNKIEKIKSTLQSLLPRSLKRVHSLASRSMDYLVHCLRVTENASDDDRILVPLDEYFSFISDEKDRSDAIHEAKIRYYEFARDEINREDQISFSRLNIALLSQGFVGSVLAWLAAEKLFSGFQGLFLLFAISVFGLILAYFSFHGVDSARRSLLFAKDQWVFFNRVNGSIYPSIVPQLSKRSNRHSYDCVKPNTYGPDLEAEAASGSETSRQLDRKELLDGEFYQFSHKRRPYRDEGWDFALSFPVLMIVVWSVLALYSLVTIAYLLLRIAVF
jgi:hypothetical protein